ncbi:MAG: HlyD family type I secretion periplasmic adaptor subunit [Azospira sp.]|jgi:protease secretion system membrane fusion protein|nr:HlyD family type I secretion periplasmic adaptor subunit [Azospira sp.]
MDDKNEKTSLLARPLQKLLPSRAHATETLDGAPELAVDTARPMRLGYRVLGYGLGLFLLWAAFAPLDEGVPAMATVMLDTKRKAVQHQQGGIIKEVLVREGQVVQEGDTLIRLDDDATRAGYESIRQHYVALRALESRLLAEQLGAEVIDFHPDLVAAAEDSFVRQHMDNQTSLLRARRLSLQAELQGIEESIRGQQAMQQGFKDMLPHRNSQIALLREELAGIRELVAEGYAPRTRQMELERLLADVSASTADLQGNAARTQNAIAELKMRALQRKQEYQKEIDTHLAEVRREVEADADKLRAAAAELGRTEIKAPTTGQIVGLNAQTVGGVIQPYQTVMDVVPENETLLLEIHVPPHLIDRIQPDDLVDVRFNAFAHSPQLVVEGRLLSISGDLLADPSGQLPPYYLARAVLTPEGMEKLGRRTMQPGMPAEVVIKTGHRSLLTYLLHPLVKRIAASLTEE